MPKCDECGCEVSDRRARRVVGYVGKFSPKEHVFCAPCHVSVFALSDHVEYPALFEHVAPWSDDLGEWRPAAEAAARLGIRAWDLAQQWRSDGCVMGITYDRMWDDRRNRWLYRGVQ